MATLVSEPQGAELKACLTVLYNSYRTALMNRKYYGCRLDWYQKLNRGLEGLIAVGSSSAIGAWAIWREGSGPILWATLAGLATLLAVIKPFLGLAQAVERYTKLYVGHGDAFFDFRLLAEEAGRKHHYSDEMDASYRKAKERIREMAPEDDPKPDEKLRRRCFEEVKKEIPANELWLPT